MNKTTVYLPDDLKAAIAAEANRRGISKAEVIRTTLWRTTLWAGLANRSPRGAIFEGDPMADRGDDLLTGFGRHQAAR